MMIEWIGKFFGKVNQVYWIVIFEEYGFFFNYIFVDDFVKFYVNLSWYDLDKEKYWSKVFFFLCGSVVVL